MPTAANSLNGNILALICQQPQKLKMPAQAKTHQFTYSADNHALAIMLTTMPAKPCPQGRPELARMILAQHQYFIKK